MVTISILIITAIITFAFYSLVNKIINQKNIIDNMNFRLNSSDEEYIHIFNLNMELTDRLESFEKKAKKSTKKNDKNWYDESKESRMNIIGQNGNEGTHYEQQKN